MNAEQLREVTLHLLGEIAPDAPIHDLAPDAELCDALALDSLDFLNFVIAVHETLRVDVPEADYAELRTLRGCVAYLARVGAPRPSDPSGAREWLPSAPADPAGMPFGAASRHAGK